VEESLETLYNSEGFGYLNESHNLEVKPLEEEREEYIIGEIETMKYQDHGHMGTTR
jgi:hypothetical protein